MSELQTHKQGPAWDYLQKWGYLKKRVASGLKHTVAIMDDGTARACGGDNGALNVAGWTDLKEVVCMSRATVGLRQDGGVYISGGIDSDYTPEGTPISEWPKNIKTISADSLGDHILGLTRDGSVYAWGRNTEGQCNTGDWENIIDICTTYNFSAGVRKDGTVVLCGDNTLAQKVSSWKNVEHIYAKASTLVGIQYDGKVLIASINEKDQFDVSDWEGIIDVSLGSGEHDGIVGLKGNGDICFSGNLPTGFFKQLHNILSINIENSYLVAITDYGTFWIKKHCGLGGEATIPPSGLVMTYHSATFVIFIDADGKLSSSIDCEGTQIETKSSFSWGQEQINGWRISIDCSERKSNECIDNRCGQKKSILDNIFLRFILGAGLAILAIYVLFFMKF